MLKLKLQNTLSKEKEIFTPIDANSVKIYVCGPTVYDTPHLGNARAIVVYDLLFRILRLIYGADHVTYVRNITDIDDKIIDRAKDLGIKTNELAEKITKIFHEICHSLGCLKPNFEPKATEHLEEMFDMINKLLENGYAYERNGHVYFRVKKFDSYSKLSGRKLEELIAGARIEVSENKEDPADFVLWKPAEENSFDSPFGKGRPGWHIECSAMSFKFLGENFDIHGGGADLMFPHHTNEIAQSCAARPGSKFANFWVHNGFLTVEGEKMSKSLGNFITANQLMDAGIPGELIRFCLLSTHYRKPFDWSELTLASGRKNLSFFYEQTEFANDDEVPEEDFLEILSPLFDDLNVSIFISSLHEISKKIAKLENGEEKTKLANLLKKAGQFFGIFSMNQKKWENANLGKIEISEDEIENLIAERNEAKKAKNWQKSDEIRDFLLSKNVQLEDGHQGTSFRRV